MNKKVNQRKKKKQQPVSALIWLVGGGVLLIATALFLAFGGKNDSGNGTPALAVDQETIEYGDVKFNTNLTFEVKVTNTGDGMLRFKEAPYIEVREGCWPPKLTIGSMVLKPGESTTIQSSTFMMHEGMDGPHDFAVHINTNDPVQPNKIVSVLSNWIP